MAMAAGAALLRSVATKMARAPPRLPYALEHHGRLPTSSRGLPRFSTCTGGSMPPSANLGGPQTYEDPRGHGWNRPFKAAVIDAALHTAAPLLVFAWFTYFDFIPRLDRMNAKLEASLGEEMKSQPNESGHAALDSMGSQNGARDVVSEFPEGQGKEHPLPNWWNSPSVFK